MAKTLRNAMLAAAVLLTGVLSPVEGQVSQGEIAEDILSRDRSEQLRGLRQVEAMERNTVTATLREALIRALERENAAHAEQREAMRRGVPYEETDDFHARITQAVIALRDPHAIPALIGVLGNGIMAARALAEFGEAAAPAVVEVVMAPDSHSSLVNGGLIALRFMVERGGVQPLSAASMHKIRGVAEQHLTRRHSGIGAALRWAIDLASVLDDADLREIIRSIAEDRNQVIARGITAPDLIEHTQKRAADRLAGVSPLPRWR